MIGAKSLFHVSLHIKDVKRSLEFYKKVGFTFMYELKVGGDDAEPWAVMLRIAHGQHLELQSVNAETPEGIPDNDGKVEYRTDQTVWHFALETDDLESWIRDLRSKGIRVWTGPDATCEVFDLSDALDDGYGMRIAWIIDPDGTPIELMEQAGNTLERQSDPE